MGMLPKGFGSGNNLKDSTETLEGCTIALCPTCKREFYRDENHKSCNMCIIGLVWNSTGYKYYPGLDQSRQKEFDI